MKEKGLYNATVYELYTGEKIERTYADLDIINEIFKENDQNMVCIGDTIYTNIKGRKSNPAFMYLKK